MNIIQEEKKAIRKEVARRKKLADEAYISQASQAILQKLTESKEYQEARQLLIYLDFNREVMTRNILRKAWQDGKETAVPRVNGEEMDFYQIKELSGLKVSSFGIEEPGGNQPVDWEDALMIMPGVAFDGKRHRIGYGGGFYDRYLAKHPNLTCIAVAFSFQIFEELPYEERDICPQAIVTENRIYT
ncbi:MAG: 5-formyltetrahydrofolate cyclo-ligase [Blautia sp.]|nr:5-formyltetrahydrofolate cyclo-ligase [Blautia sp.]